MAVFPSIFPTKTEIETFGGTLTHLRDFDIAKLLIFCFHRMIP